MFEYVSPFLMEVPTNRVVKKILEKTLFKKSDFSAMGSEPILDDQEFRTVSLQLKTLGLVRIDYSRTTTGVMDLLWSLTPTGEKLMIEIRTVRATGTNTEK
jgi:hypothetical protein